jgi:catechol 2,3-dioxygenase-like lactoylglutathione lyase family enzyme
MTTPLPHLVQGVDHVAYPTFDPVATVRFYRDALGLPVVHAICAKGWGPNDHPDFVHFFFDLGHGDRLAFFYYFGLERYEDQTPWLLRHSSRHLAIHVESPAVLDAYQARLAETEWPVHMRVVHETIESIYVVDPNDYLIELTCPTRPAVDADQEDAELTVQAMVEVVAGGGAPSIDDLWARKAELIVSRAGQHAGASVR